MSRTQTPTYLPNEAIAAPNVPQPLSPIDIWVKSFTLTAPVSNVGTVYFGDATLQTQYLAPGDSAIIYGDAMDNGTTARVNIAETWIVAPNAADELAIGYLLGE